MSAKSPSWQLQTAKNRFSEVVERSRSEGPQIVTRHGRKAAVIMSFEDYERLTGRKAPRRSFKEHLLSAPKVKGGLVIKRSTDTGRKVDLE